ncbi:MAG TPA: HD domain-containing phosphohydrolase [Actinomycetota bacterium]|nr:HD domain-containing phosphohydrolase [Actinomycetota bacterium]
MAALWLSDPSRERLRAALGCAVTTDPAGIDQADLVIISTRGPRARAIPLARSLRSRETLVGVVCHAGGENVALEIMRAGGTAVVAEGNERALKRLLAPGESEEGSLLATYEQRVGSHRAEEASTSSADRITGLPGASSFETRLAELIQAGTPATVGFARITNFTEATSGLDPQAMQVLTRRISVLYRDLAERAGVELFVLSPARYGFVARELHPEEVQNFGLGLAEIAQSFAPGGTVPLLVRVGHAGPEVASDVSLLRDLAEHALEAAAAQEGIVVASAEHLSDTLVSSTELDLALRMIEYLSEHDGYPGSHSSRVAEYATELARFLGYEGRDLMRIRLSALLHDVGKVGLPPEAMRPSPDLDAASVEAYRSHAERGARYAEVTAGRQIADAIRYHHECWDGSGFPQGLSGEDIPMAARIIAVADAYDALRTTPSETGRPPSSSECMERLRAGSDSLFDPVVVEAALMAFPR